MAVMYLVYVPIYETDYHDDDVSYHRHNVGITIYGVYTNLNDAKKRCIQVYERGLRGPSYPISKLEVGDDTLRHVKVPKIKDTDEWGLVWDTGIQSWEVYIRKVPLDSDEWDWDNPPGENITLAGFNSGPKPNLEMSGAIEKDLLKRIRVERILDLE